MLIAFEGLDQSGKQTQAELLTTALRGRGREVLPLAFPAYDTAIGEEIARALRGERNHTADVMQLLYVANRCEFRPRIAEALARSAVVVCDRYLASSVAYGEAQGLDPAWLTSIQQVLPQPDLTFLLDIAPEDSLARKRESRDCYERDLALLARVRQSYHRQSTQTAWVRLDGTLPKAELAEQVLAQAARRLGLRSGPAPLLPQQP